jgi:ATP synthase protein I
MSIITPDPEFDVNESDEEDFKQLSAEEVKVLIKLYPVMSPWRILAMQVLVGLVLALVVRSFSGNGVAAWSVAYGALAVVIPAALFARGLARQQKAPNAGSALSGFFVWELVKIALTVAMLFAAPRLILGLHWLALLAGFVVTMKVYWVAMWLHSARNKSVK